MTRGTARERLQRDQRGVALYHVVYAHEGFDEAAMALHRLVRRAIETCPGRDRVLFLDVDGHRDEKGVFDHDMLELQEGFVLGLLLPFLTAAHLPLIAVR